MPPSPEPLSFQVIICSSPSNAGLYGAAKAAAALNTTLARKGRARLLLSTGQSQFETIGELVRRPVDWRGVDAFHLDEYVGLSDEHPASFRRYLRERFAEVVPASMHYVDPGSPDDLQSLAQIVEQGPIDVALVGIGENGHIAFNDPPADFSAREPYIKVNLDERCRQQQVSEGWFAELSQVPAQAVTMSVNCIMRAAKIISVVPHFAKAPVMRRLLTSSEVTPDLPASVLSGHPDVTVVLDRASAQLLPDDVWARCVVL